MKEWWGETHNKYAVLVVSAILGTGVYQFVCWSQLSRSDWAAWVQAVGSIGAILAAVWVSYNQHEKQMEVAKQRVTEEILGMLYSLRSEIETSIQSIQDNIGVLLSQPAATPAFRTTYPVSDNPFAIYSGLIPKLGMIPDHNIRNQIVLCYTKAQSLVLTFRYNNQLVDEYEAAEDAAKKTGHPHDNLRVSQAIKRLDDYGASLRRSYAEVISDAKALLNVLPVK
jgi:hypothetical protein